MEKKILIVRNIARECPGLIEQILKEKNIGFDVVDLDDNGNFPDLKLYCALFVLGGPDSANDKTAKMKDELSRIKEAIDKHIPYFGICLGMQALIKANNGEVFKNHVKEIGWKNHEGNYFEVELTDNGKDDPLFKGVSPKFEIFHLHGETVRINNSMKLLGIGKHCTNQVVRIGDNAYGFQGHLELTNEMFNDWLEHDPDLSVLDKSSIVLDYNNIKPVYEANARKIFTNFLKII